MSQGHTHNWRSADTSNTAKKEGASQVPAVSWFISSWRHNRPRATAMLKSRTKHQLTPSLTEPGIIRWRTLAIISFCSKVNCTAHPSDAEKKQRAQQALVLCALCFVLCALCFVLCASCFVLRASCFVLRASCLVFQVSSFGLRLLADIQWNERALAGCSQNFSRRRPTIFSLNRDYLPSK